MADDEGGGSTAPRREEYERGGERRRERASRESDRDGEGDRDRERDKGRERRRRDVDVNRERDRGVRDRNRDRDRDRDKDMDRDRHRSHDRERRSREYGGDRDKRHRHRSRSSSRGRSQDVSRSRSRSRSRSMKTSGFDKAAPSAAVGSSAAIPGIERRFQAASNDNIFGELQPQQSNKVAVDSAVRSNLGADSHQSEVHDGEVQGNKSASVPVAKTGKSSKWGPAPSSDDAMASEVATDFEAAKLAAIRAAEIVNKNLSLAGFMSADHKKKLLWGSKKAQVEQEPVVAAAGTNRWDTVHFSDRDRMEKFHKLMGVKGDVKEGEALPPPPSAGAFTEEKQRELQADLEKQFTQGLRRRDGRTVGLGL